MWLTISSLIVLLSFADLGIGYGLLNRVTRSLARGAIASARIEISSATTLLGALALGLAVVFAVSFPYVSWQDVLAVRSPTAAAEAGPAVAAFTATFLLGIPLSVATQVRVARQEGYVTHVALATGSLASLGALILVILWGGGVPALVVAMAAPPLAATAINAAVLFTSNAPELRPALRHTSSEVGLALIRSGFLFLVLQMSIVVAFATDRLLIAHLVGPEAVSEYGVTQTLFSVPIGIAAIAVTPLWPAYGEAITRGDIAWVRSSLRRSLKIAIGITLPSAVALVAFGSTIIDLWVGDAVAPSIALLLGFGIWIVQGSVGHSAAIFLNGADEIRAQAIAALVMATTNIALSIWLIRQLGVAGAIWGTVITYGLFVLVPMAIYVPATLRRVGATRSDGQVTS